MDITEQEILLGYVAEGLGIPRDAAKSSLLNEEGLLIPEAKEFLLSTNRNKVKTIKDNASAEGYSAAKKAERSALESEIKTKFGFDSDATGVSLIEKLLETKIPKGDNIPEEVIKKHPAFITLEGSVNDRLKSAVKEVEDKYQLLQRKSDQEKIDSHVLNESQTLLGELSPVIPKDAKRAKTFAKTFNDMVLNLSYEVKEVGTKKVIVLLDPTDKSKVKRLEDEHGNPIKFEDAIREIAEAVYELAESEDRSSAGDPNKKGKSTKGKDAGHKFDLKMPKNDAEYRSALVDIDGDSSLDIKTRIAKKSALKEMYHGKAD